ncbi:hypothetical protein [Wolbachia endosymbiont of Wuchereria bancrofti]|uniref:hypothetical protein n=1 Tax=Wolbachia endosymbiont of Wuchereria bancrofti TaxID=96496 RepID=UPI000345158F|nr:hypothetical protein [Wolbachia endosymbiont of Wuchereria bancrofti]
MSFQQKIKKAIDLSLPQIVIKKENSLFVKTAAVNASLHNTMQLKDSKICNKLSDIDSADYANIMRRLW